MGNSSGKPVVFTDEVNLTHFRLLRVVGKGAFGKVRIVERKDTGLTFALKYIRKDEIVRSESVRNIIRERRMLQQLNHPFLCNLRYSFQDMEYLYIVVDLMNGGDLRFHISRKTFTEDAIRFWLAELACALRYIHKKGIVHRDVKPDNILLDSDGHVHLADFNVASDFTPERRLTSKSGTLAYLAPEVYEGRGYTSEVDWWSLGVTFYECIYNKRPFEGSTQESLKKKIMEARPSYPATNPPVSNACVLSLSSLLEKDKRRRIGAAGFASFTDSPFFAVFDFEALERKELEPIFKPSAEKTNFDATYDLEELLLEEAPLEARARRQKPREQLKDDATQEEIRHEELHRMIEQLFEPFDYTHAAYDVTPTGRSTDRNNFASIPNQSMAPHTNSNPKTRPERDPGIHAKSRDRSATDQSLSWSTPMRTRSSTHSPNGSPPLNFGSGIQQDFESHTSHLMNFEDRTDRFTRPSLYESPQGSRPSSATPGRARRVERGGSISPDPFRPRDQYVHYHHNSSPLQTQIKHGPDRRQPQHRMGRSTSATQGGSYGGPLILSEIQDWGDLALAGGASLSSRPSASTLANITPSSTQIGFEGDERSGAKPSGMLGFLGRKKGRDRSPRGGPSDREKTGRKGKERERGVLGKEGARVIVGPG